MKMLNNFLVFVGIDTMTLSSWIIFLLGGSNPLITAYLTDDDVRLNKYNII